MSGSKMGKKAVDERIKGMQLLSDERYRSAKAAIKLAKKAADDSARRVPIVGVISIVALLLGIAGYFK